MEFKSSDTVDEVFAENVRLIREARGLSQLELAQLMREKGWSGLRQTTISRIEKFERTVKLGEAVALAQVLQVSLTSLTSPSRVVRVHDRLQLALHQVSVLTLSISSRVHELLEARIVLSAVISDALRGSISSDPAAEAGSVERALGYAERTYANSHPSQVVEDALRESQLDIEDDE